MLLLAASALVVASCGTPSSVPTPFGVRSHVDTVFYDIDGVTPRMWIASIGVEAERAGVPAHHQAQTTWSSRWSYAATRMGRSQCEAVNLLVEASIRFTMPRLRSDSLVSAEGRAEWKRFSTSLWAHENGHALRAMRAAGLQLDILRHLRTSACLEFPMQAQREPNAVRARYDLLDREYDERTRHGVRQGTMLIVDPRRPLAVDTTYRDTIP